MTIKKRISLVMAILMMFGTVSFAENMETDPLETILSGMTLRELPAEGSSWSANLPAGLLACFGAGPAEGACPVKLPELDDQYMPKAEMPLE